LKKKQLALGFVPLQQRSDLRVILPKKLVSKSEVFMETLQSKKILRQSSRASSGRHGQQDDTTQL
jgi:hypothetical protein